MAEAVTREIELVEHVASRRVVQVTFPVYSKTDLSSDALDSEVWSRWDASGMKWTLHCIHDCGTVDVEWSIEAERVYERDGCITARDIGLGKYACTKEEFDNAVREAMQFLGEIGVAPKVEG